MSGWGCPHQESDKCNRVAGRPCDPGMKGCILAGRFRFTNPGKNRDGADPLGDADGHASASSQADEFPRYQSTPVDTADER